MTGERKEKEQSPDLERGIAIIGMSCIFPGAPSLDAFWENIIQGVDAVREASDEEWSANWYKNKPASEFGNIYCTRGGFITDYADFDPLEFGIMPASLNGADPDQFLALRVAAEALNDAGYHHKTFQAERAEVIVGRTMAPGVGSLNLIQHGQTVDQVIEVLSVIAPQLKERELTEIAKRLHESLNPCNADTIPAVMPNVLSGRIAGKLGFGGRNLVLDAACASSLIAVEAAVQSLQSGQADLAIAGGVHINSSPYFYQMFCELGALSRSGTIRPFDEKADGTILGEGIGMVVLKRLADAVRDKNKIYAVIRGIASSSDGRGASSLAPNVEGEALSMQRAYEMSGIAPRTVELMEAHGTGTRAGDLAEMKAVQKIFAGSALDSESQWCALGSIKSMIGHTQAASGIAGLIKVALALHHKILPPTLHVEKPNSQLDWSRCPCYINTSTRQWAAPASRLGTDQPRRAAISAFGFGGVNAHAVLEEYSEPAGNQNASPRRPRQGSLASSRLLDEASVKTVRLSLRYPALKAQNLSDLQVCDRMRSERPTISESISIQAKEADHVAFFQSEVDDESMVMQGFIRSLGAFQERMLGVQEKVMRKYFEETQDNPSSQ